MTGDRIDVEGADRLAATLHSASDDIKDMDAANEKTGRLLLTRARTAAPRDTGRLAGSIVMAKDNGELTVGTNVVYAAVQEFGWAAHNISAQPYLIGPSEDMAPVFTDYYRADAQRALSHVEGA